MAKKKKKNYSPGKEIKKKGQVSKPPQSKKKRIQKKYQTREDFRLASKQGITRKDLTQGRVSKPEFTNIVTRERTKEKAVASRQKTQNRKLQYAKSKGIPEQYLSQVSRVKEKDLDKWIKQVKKQDYHNRKVELLRSKGVHESWIPKLARENGLEKLQSISKDLFPQFYEDRNRPKFNPDKIYKLREYLYIGLSDKTGFHNLFHRSAYYQTLTPEEAGANVQEVNRNRKKGSSGGSTGQAGVLRIVIDSDYGRIQDELNRWEKLDSDPYQTVCASNEWSLNKILRTVSFVMSSVTEEYQQILLSRVDTYLRNNSDKLYQEYIKYI